MFRPSIFLLLLAPPGAAALAQGGTSGQWTLAPMADGCMLQAISPQGTMLSIWGRAGEEELGFLLQNRGWNALRDGQSYELNVEFTGLSSWPIAATAREHIDADGPGYFFNMAPGAASADGFLDALASARGMSISRDGRAVDSLPLAGSREAMASLARCLSESWAEPPEPAETAEAASDEAPAIPST